MANKTPPIELIKRFQSEKCIPSALLIVCPDPLRQSRIISTLLEASAQGRQRQPETINKNCRDLRADDVERLKHDFASLSLFSPQRVFIMREVNQATAPIERLLIELITASHEGAVVIFVAPQLTEKHALRTAFEKLDALLEFPALAGQDLVRWTQRELKEQGVAVESSEAIEALIHAGEDRPELIEHLVTHISLYLDGEELTVKTIGEVFLSRSALNDFELLDLVGAGNRARAQVMIDRLLDEGRNPIMIHGMIARAFSRYLSIQTMLSRGLAPNDIREAMKTKPWIFNKELSSARRYSLEGLKSATTAIMQADEKLKGRSSGPTAVLSQLIDSLLPSS